MIFLAIFYARDIEPPECAIDELRRSFWVEKNADTDRSLAGPQKLLGQARHLAISNALRSI